MVTPAWVNPNEPEDEEIDRVIRGSGLQTYRPMFFPERAGIEPERQGGRRRPPVARRQKWVNAYFVEMEARQNSCIVRLSVYNFKKGELHLKATWSGYDRAACDIQFERVVATATSAVIGRSREKK